MSNADHERASKEPQRLTERHRAVLRRLAAGESVSSISQSLGMCPQHISRVRCSQVGRDYMAQLQNRLDSALVHSCALATLARLAPELLR